MSDDRKILDEVRGALHSEPRVRSTGGPLHLAFAAGDLAIEGEVDHIAGKKLALEAAARVPGVQTITDRLHVRPATSMGDGEIRDRVRDGLLEEPALSACGVRVLVKGDIEIARAPASRCCPTLPHRPPRALPLRRWRGASPATCCSPPCTRAAIGAGACRTGTRPSRMRWWTAASTLCTAIPRITRRGSRCIAGS